MARHAQAGIFQFKTCWILSFEKKANLPSFPDWPWVLEIFPALEGLGVHMN
jgi:hypothetical protein